MKKDVSDIAKLRRQIIEEMEAMQSGLEGFATGTARHEFIQARMQNIGDHQCRLAKHIGTGNAVNIVCELYINTVQVPASKKR